MTTTVEDTILALYEPTIQMLHELGIGIHRLGYRQLSVGIPRFTLDESQSLSKELYPYIAKQFGYADWHPVEHAIRVAILVAWENRNPEVWEIYFPNAKKPPSNKQFIATLAERLK